MVEQSAKTMTETKKSLRAEIDGIHVEMFEEIKKENNFKYDSEVVRYCISETKKQAEFSLKDSYWKKINQLMDYDHVRYTHHIDNISSFIDHAIEYYIDYLESNFSSLYSFEVRSRMDGMELDVALAFINCQTESVAGQVDIETLAQKMNKRNLNELTDIIDRFINQGLVQKKVHEGKIFYYTPKPDTM